MAGSEKNVGPWVFIVRDAAKLVALLLLVGGGVSNYYIFKSDLQRATEHITENTKLIRELSSALYQHRLADRDDSARITANDRRLTTLERRRRER